MNVRMEVSPESEIVLEHDQAGNLVAVNWRPLFPSRQGTAVLGYFKSTSELPDQEPLDVFSLVASGNNGKVSKKVRSKGVRALIDLSEEERRSLKVKDEDLDEPSE